MAEKLTDEGKSLKSGIVSLLRIPDLREYKRLILYTGHSFRKL